MDSNKENDGIEFADGGSNVLFPFDLSDLLDMDFNPYDDYYYDNSSSSYDFGGETASFSANPQAQPICNPESELPLDLGEGFSEGGIGDEMFDSFEGEGQCSYKANEEEDAQQPVCFFADATIQRLCDNNKLIFNSINTMYQIEEQASSASSSSQAIEVRACSDEAMARFQMGEFQRVKAVTIQQPQDRGEVSCGGAGYDGHASPSGGMKRGKHPGKKFQERHRASIVGTASTLKVQSSLPSSKRSNGRKPSSSSSKKTSSSLSVMRLPGRRDSVY